MNDVLDWSISDGWCLTLYFKGEYEPELTGFVHSYSDTTILLTSEREMGFDGFIIVNRNHVFDIKILNRDIFATELMRRCGQKIEQVKVPSIDISTLGTVLEYFHQTNELVCVRERHLAVDKDDQDEDFYQLGVIANVLENKVEVLEFDAVAIWEKDITEIEMGDVTQIEWEGRYLNTFRSFFDEFTNPQLQ